MRSNAPSNPQHSAALHAKWRFFLLLINLLLTYIKREASSRCHHVDTVNNR
nr:MAG TPA: hypothetical protein [Caudoviricetes sp.]